jgi:molybdopterin synthase catalytic subunit
MDAPAITITETDFSVAGEYDKLRKSARATGAIVTFTGLVRDVTDEQAVSKLTLQHYPEMTEKLLDGIIKDASERWEIDAVRVVHRVGELRPTDQIVFVGVAAKHRGNAFEACAFIMDYLKVKATIWKKESRPEGEVWLAGRDADQQAIDRWKS